MRPLLLFVAACAAPRPMVPSEDSRIARVEENLTPPVVIEGRGAGRPLPERMAHHGVGGVSLAVLEQGRLIWARAYGALAVSSPLPTEGLGLDVPARATAAEIAGALAKLPRGGAQLRRQNARGAVVFDPRRGQGAVVMTDTDRAAPLVGEILRCVAAEYRWPGYPGPTVKRTLDVPAERLAEYSGTYRIEGGVSVEIAVAGERLTIATTDGAVAELYPEARDRFFLLDREARVTFERDAAGNVTALTAYIDGRQIRAPRR
jgi:hypothetical protein